MEIEILCLIIFYVVLLVSIVVAGIWWRNRRMQRLREQAEALSSQFEASCPICGNNEGAWGLVAAQHFIPLLPRGQRAKSMQILGFRCSTCGHLMFFTEPPERIKRKREVESG